MQKLFILGGALLITLSACHSTDSSKRLPYLGTREPITKEINGQTITDTVYQKAPSFTLLNQDSIIVTERNFDNSIYVTDFFFTSCPTICPTMSRNMLKIYQKYQDQSEVKFLSHTIDTKYDTPSVLKAYADKLGVKGTQWQFVTGKQADVYNLAPGYMVLTPEVDADEPGGFIHQGWFILVDKEKHIRGAYDGTNDEQVAQLMKDMDTLLAEYQQP